MPASDQLTAQLDRLAAFAPGPYPVISLYLNLQPNEIGRDQVEPFLRRELTSRIRTYPADGPERTSLLDDAEKVRAVAARVDPAANGLAVFACTAAGLLESVTLAPPIPEHRLFISDQPHLYP